MGGESILALARISFAKTGTVAVLLMLAVSTDAFADGLRTDVGQLLSHHKRVEAAKLDLEAAQQRLETARGGWYPTFDSTASYGWEEQNKGQGTDDTSMPPRILEMSLSQLIYDFGATDAAIDRARLEVMQARQTLISTTQNVALEAVNAWYGVVRQRKLLEFNFGSVENVKKQMQLEDARVQRGSGLATDVLQAKSQLAGLEATRTRLQGALTTAVNRYRAVFGKEPPKSDPKNMKLPKLPLDMLPATLDEAIAIANENNPRLKATYLGTLMAGATVAETKASEFYPELNASAERNLKEDEGGTIGGKQETLVKVELTYSLNLGMTGTNTLKAAELSQRSGISRFQEERDLVEERVRNAWSDLETAKLRVEQLRNQTNIASEFLELARRERQLGNRSLIDVLAGETALINATSDATSAEVDVVQAVYRLLTSLGRLQADVVPE